MAKLYQSKVDSLKKAPEQTKVDSLKKIPPELIQNKKQVDLMIEANAKKLLDSNAH